MKKFGSFETDVFPTSVGELAITFLGHASLILEFAGNIIHVDPYGQAADYSNLPNADLVICTHDHYDHLDEKALNNIRKPDTQLVMNPAGADHWKDAIAIKNGESRTVAGIVIEAVPAYNLVHMREDGHPFHPQGDGNGYILNFGNTRMYIAGDTENIPEMKNLREITIAFLPMNLPYTMTPEMVAEAAKIIRPKILYPYHYGDTDVSKLVDLLKNEKDIEVRIRKMP